MVTLSPTVTPKPNLEEIKKKAAAALGFDVIQQQQQQNQQQESEEGVKKVQNENGVALNGFTPPAPAGYSQTGDNFVGVPPSQVVPNTAYPSLPPPEVARTIPCRFWPNCRYGDECAFAHDPSLAPAPQMNTGAPSIPALPTPQDSPVTSSPAQMMPQQQPVHPAMMGGFYYPYPNEPMQDYYAPQPYPPMHQPYYHGYPPHAPQFSPPPQQQAPLDPRFAYGYPAYPAPPPPQPQVERQNSSPPMHPGVPTAPRAQQQAQQQQMARSQPSPTSQHQQTDDSNSPSSQQQPLSADRPQSDEATSPNAESALANNASMHTFFQTNSSQPYNPEAVMNASGIPPARYNNALSSSSNRRASSLPGSQFTYTAPRTGLQSSNPFATSKTKLFTQPRHTHPCTFFSQSNCRNGDSCPFAHYLQDGTDAKLLRKNIIGPDGTEADPAMLDSFRKSEGVRREKLLSGAGGQRMRGETYPGFREGRFGLSKDQNSRGRFGANGGNSSSEGEQQARPVSKESRPAQVNGSRASSTQRIPNGSDFPALPAPTTPVFEKNEFTSATSSSSKEDSANPASPPSEQPTEAVQSPSAPVQAEAKPTPAPTNKLSFSFASAAARGATVPPPQKKSTRPAQVQVSSGHSADVHHTNTNSAPMPVAVA